MRRLGRILAFYVGLWVAACSTSTAQAQVPTTTYSPPRQGVLSRFAPRGGIGTTPFLGNVRGLGSNSVNYDKVAPEVKSSYKSYNRRWFRRTK